jgi:hypothetical protein
MNDEPTAPSPRNLGHASEAPPVAALEARLAGRPVLRARLHRLLDTLEQSIDDGSDAHAAEERVIEELRQLGQEYLGQWAEEAGARAQAEVPRAHPEACRNGKKKS